MSLLRCPYLDQADTQSNVSLPNHACSVSLESGEVPIETQERFCLSGQYEHCERFRSVTPVRAPAAFASAVARFRRSTSEACAPARPPMTLSPLSAGLGNWGIGVIGLGLLVAMLWISALALFPDQIALALAPPPTQTVAVSPPVSAATVIATAIPLPTSTLIATLTPLPTATSAAMSTATAIHVPAPAVIGLNVPSRLIIPAIELDAPVVSVSWTLVARGGKLEPVWDTARNAAGWHINSAMPGQAGNIVLSGHHNIDGMVFRDLFMLKAGDEIVLHAGDETFHYRVGETMTLQEWGISESRREENARWIGPFPDDRLTLVTCWPQYNNSHRVIVVAFPSQSDEVLSLPAE